MEEVFLRKGLSPPLLIIIIFIYLGCSQNDLSRMMYFQFKSHLVNHHKYWCAGVYPRAWARHVVSRYNGTVCYLCTSKQDWCR